MNPAEILRISLFFVSVAALATGQQQEGQKTTKKEDDAVLAKRYGEQEPPFRPPPLPIQRKLQVFSGAEQPPSFFSRQAESEAESRQFQVQPLGGRQPITLQQPTSFPQVANTNQFQQRQQFDQNNFQQFEQAKAAAQNVQNVQLTQDQSQQSFQDQNNFQSRQQETLLQRFLRLFNLGNN